MNSTWFLSPTPTPFPFLRPRVVLRIGKNHERSLRILNWNEQVKKNHLQGHRVPPLKADFRMPMLLRTNKIHTDEPQMISNSCFSFTLAWNGWSRRCCHNHVIIYIMELSKLYRDCPLRQLVLKVSASTCSPSIGLSSAEFPKFPYAAFWLCPY